MKNFLRVIFTLIILTLGIFIGINYNEYKELFCRIDDELS